MAASRSWSGSVRDSMSVSVPTATDSVMFVSPPPKERTSTKLLGSGASGCVISPGVNRTCDGINTDESTVSKILLLSEAKKEVAMGTFLTNIFTNEPIGLDVNDYIVTPVYSCIGTQNANAAAIIAQLEEEHADCTSRIKQKSKKPVKELAIVTYPNAGLTLDDIMWSLYQHDGHDGPPSDPVPRLSAILDCMLNLTEKVSQMATYSIFHHDIKLDNIVASAFTRDDDALALELVNPRLIDIGLVAIAFNDPRLNYKKAYYGNKHYPVEALIINCLRYKKGDPDYLAALCDHAVEVHVNEVILRRGDGDGYEGGFNSDILQYMGLTRDDLRGLMNLRALRAREFSIEHYFDDTSNENINGYVLLQHIEAYCLLVTAICFIYGVYDQQLYGSKLQTAETPHALALSHLLDLFRHKAIAAPESTDVGAEIYYTSCFLTISDVYGALSASRDALLQSRTISSIDRSRSQLGSGSRPRTRQKRKKGSR